jgi:hypothetical protein
MEVQIDEAQTERKQAQPNQEKMDLAQSPLRDSKLLPRVTSWRDYQQAQAGHGEEEYPIECRALPLEQSLAHEGQHHGDRHS